jgi:hypothetical protein
MKYAVILHSSDFCYVASRFKSYFWTPVYLCPDHHSHCHLLSLLKILCSDEKNTLCKYNKAMFPTGI